MSTGKKVAGLVVLSLITGAGVAGGVYVANTPTSVTSRASSSSASPTQLLGLRATLPTLSPVPTAQPVTTPRGGAVTEDAIVKAFGTSNASLDQNGDGTVNALDLQIFRSKQK